jgi:predicted Zn-dependent peptidase
LQNITIDDCKNYYQTYFKPNIAYLVIVGDITIKEAKKTAKKYFGSWKQGDIPSHDFKQVADFSRSSYVVAHKEGANQSFVTVSYPVNLVPGSQDALKVAVMNQILGGRSFSARLMQNLREDKAWTYGAYSSIKSDEYMGYFKAAANVRAAITDSAFVEIQKEMQQLIADRVDSAHIQLVKNSLAGSFGRSLEDPATPARFALNIDKYNLPHDYYETYMERLEAITIEDVQEMAKKYIRPENALYLAVGDVDIILPLMQKIAGEEKVTEYDFYVDEVKR